MGRIDLNKGMIVGLVGGFVGTLVMDLVLAVIFLMVGMPADLTFSFVGDTVVHYLIGLGLGGSLGIAVSQVEVPGLDSMKKSGAANQPPKSWLRQCSCRWNKSSGCCK